MKRLIMLSLLLVGLLANNAMSAEPLHLDVGFVQLVLPFQNVYGEYLYDVRFQKNLIGMATPLILGKEGKNRLSIGGAKEEGRDGIVSYVGFDSEVSDKYFTERASVGVWVGADFGLPGRLEDKVRGGLKGSVKFW